LPEVRYVILHYHILKNAGSTIEEILVNSFWENFHRFDTSDRDASIQNAELVSFVESHPGLKAVTSHQIRHPVPVVPGYIFLDCCFLRDPIDRIKSMYEYFRDKPVAGDPVSECARGLGLGEFVQRLVDEIPWYANDVQVNLLANGIANDTPNRLDLERAAQRMLETSFLGVVDCFNESLAAGQYFLSPLFPSLDCAQPAVNVSRSVGRSLTDRKEEVREACDARIYTKLLELNALDRDLVERARAEVRRRFEMIPDGEAWLRKVAPRAAERSPGSREARTPAVLPIARNDRDAPAPIRASKGRRGAMQTLRRFARGLPFQRDPEDQYAVDQYAIDAGLAADPHPLFDRAFYARKYRDVGKANPLRHYLKHAADTKHDVARERQPHPLFDAAYYLQCNPDVRNAKVNPLAHYLLHGARENRQPHPLFLPDYYRREDGRGGENPLVHFLESEPAKCRSPHPLFDCEYYLRENPDLAGVNPLAHFLSGDAFEGRNPHPLFDSAFYLRKYPEARASGANPLVDYLTHGEAEGRQPHPLFDPVYYLQHYPDVRRAKISPLIDYVLHGARENRQPHPLFLPDYYLARYPEARGSCGGNPLIHFLRSDPKKCGSPHPLFDCEYYLRAKPDAAAYDVNPLVHYVLSGSGRHGAEAAVESSRTTLRLDVHGVTVPIVFVDAADEKLADDVVQIWKDGIGRTRFIGPPQMYPFFQALSHDQLSAQLSAGSLPRAAMAGARAETG
jgi:hypothetical protein